ncbi:NAD(P)-binding protein [Xylariaceae sp. FL1019]|nr:NAD(P)-binding protein [Xylariaceae sp. FL1019]
MDISGNAIIFGAGGAIGRATAMAFARGGARGLLVADIDLEAAQSTASDIRADMNQPELRVEAVHVDATILESVEAAFKQMVDAFGRFDYCVTTVGIPVKTPMPTADALVSEFIETQNVNVTGTFLIIRTALAIMRTQEAKPNFPDAPVRGTTRGAVVALGSALSINAGPNFIQYTTSKHAVIGLIKTAALDSVNDNIRVNCVCPCWIESNMTRSLAQTIPGFEAAMPNHMPMGRIGAPEEIADAVLFLCSPRASLVTGTSLIADGGMCVSLG